MTRWLRVLLTLGAASAGLLLFLLASATTNSALFQKHYNLLLALNGLSAAALLGWVITLTVRLLRRWRRGRFGARLTARFAMAFALVGVIPGILIYVLSVQFMSRSIESWFNVRVDTALEAGLALGRSALDGLLSDLDNKARNMAQALNASNENNFDSTLNRLRDQAGIQDAMVFTANGRVLSVASSTMLARLLEPPPNSVLQQLRLAHRYAAIESSGTSNTKKDNATHTANGASVGLLGTPPAEQEEATASLQLRVVVPLGPNPWLGLNSLLANSLPGETRYLQLVQEVPSQLSGNALTVQNGFRDYQALSLSRSGLRKLYGVTLTLALLMAILGAIAAAFAISARLTRPLLLLAQGTQAVGEGNFRSIPEPPSSDEIGILTRSFNTMTRQLEDARRLVESNKRQLEKTNVYLESILVNLSSGVLVFDDMFRLATINHGAEHILHANLSTLLGQPLEVVPELAQFAMDLKKAFAEHSAADTNQRDWQQQIELERESDSLDKPVKIILLARGSRLPMSTNLQSHPYGNSITLINNPTTSASTANLTTSSDHGHGNFHSGGYVVVFDDITELISASRARAWGEVGRRLAHEIKNPLTPIQLSAERLAIKLSAKLDENDAAVLKRSTTTIINQVASMKRMLDDFRDYARMPAALSQPVDLNELIKEVLSLYGWDPADGWSRTINRPVKLDVNLSPNLPMLMGDASQLRQVIHNLLANAHDALEESSQVALENPQEAKIEISTACIEVKTPDNKTSIRFSVTDNGNGFPASILQHAFEPYVTTKIKGTGLGLPIVKKIIEEHHGRIDLSNRPEGGAMVSILFTHLKLD